MPTRIFRTSSFRVAVFYLMLMGMTVGVLVAVIYWSTSALVARQSDETIRAEIQGLAEQYNDEGLARLFEVVRRRSGPDGNPKNVYLLADPQLRPITGNLATWPDAPPSADGWLELRLQRSSEASDTPHVVRGKAFELANNHYLFVGRDTPEREEFQRIFAQTLPWAVLPAILIGLLGSILIGRYSLHRVDSVRLTSADIIKGDLTRRVPVTGSGDEFDRLATTINDMLERIEALMEGMRLVSDSLAHDLRSPLSHAKNEIEQALRGPADIEAYKEALAQSNNEIETVLRTFRALIEIAQAETGLSREMQESMDLSSLAEDLFEVYVPIAEEAGLELQKDLSDSASIIGHRQLLGQAIANLLDNAVKYTPLGGQILMTVRQLGDQTQIVIGDSGPGIPTADRDRVLQRFVRLDNSRTSPGSGLGLSLVAAVSKLHGAQLELEDNAPGLRARITFPAP